MPQLDPSLHELADAYGIATEYWDWQGQHVEVARETVVAVLAALDVDASTSEAAASALEPVSYTHLTLPTTPYV